MDELIRLPVENKNEIKKFEYIKHKLLNVTWSKILKEIFLMNLYCRIIQEKSNI